MNGIKNTLIPVSKYWNQQMNILGYSMLMENQNTKRAVSLKFLDMITKYNKINKNFNFRRTKSPNMIKFLLAFELIGASYYLFNSFNESKQDLNINNNKNKENNLSIVNDYKYYLDKLFLKENLNGYIIDLFIYYKIAPVLFAASKALFYKTITLASLLSVLILNMENKYNDLINEELNIEQFKLFNSNNLLPKMLLTSSVLGLINNYAVNKQYRIKGIQIFNRKLFFMFIYALCLSKITRTISHFSLTEQIK